MAVELVWDEANVVRFPGPRSERPREQPREQPRERPGIEQTARLAPARSLVETLVAERGGPAHDSQAGFAREFAFLVRALEAGHGRDEATLRVRQLVDAYVFHAVDVCRAYQEAADRLIGREVDVARSGRPTIAARISLDAARVELRGRAIRGACGRRRRLGRGDGAGHLHPGGRGWLAGQSGRSTTAAAVRGGRLRKGD